MKNRTTKFLIGSLLLSVALLACVPFCDFVLSFFFGDSNQSENSKQIIAGVASETIRAFITYYLYSVTENKGSKLVHGIRHGMLYSALIGSLYIILGALYFELRSPLRFLIADTFILAIQGLVSGVTLYYIFRKDAASD